MLPVGGSKGRANSSGWGWKNPSKSGSLTMGPGKRRGWVPAAAIQLEISALCEPFGLLPMGIWDGEIPINGW